MLKKSLFFGAAALALLVLLAFAGCSNPASDDGGGAPQAGGFTAIPDGAVYTDSLVELLGLLNDFSAGTNQVRDIVFTEDVGDTTDGFTSDVTIPAGKILYLTNAENANAAFTALAANIIVEEGGRLVLLADFTTAGAGKRLLVKGQVDVYSTLTTVALDVADYFIQTSGTIDAKGTVLGTGHVVIHTDAVLSITNDDIAPEPSPDRFTPAQAWAAAGQGSLVIRGALDARYTVQDVLAGVSPWVSPSGTGSRLYVVSTNGGGILPSIIPAGAFITANGVIVDADNNTLTVNGSLTAGNAASTFEKIVTLTVNGSLTANSATFENVTTLTVSGLDSDNLASRASTTPATTWNRSYLGADSATLEKAALITIGDYGEFASESTAIVLPEGAKIRLGRSAIFNSAGTNTNSFDNLTSLFIGPASSVAIASPAVTFQSLETLTLQDSAKLVANAGTAVSFLVDTATPPRKTAIGLGKNVLYQVGVSPTAKVDVAISNDSSLLAGSGIVVNPESTFTVSPGVTLTVPNTATVDFSAVTTGATAGPTDPALAPIQISGTIQVGAGGTIIGPAPGALTNATDIAKFVNFVGDGKVLLNWGASFTTGGMKLVGPHTTSGTLTDHPSYKWSSGGTTDGAQIEINGEGITIRDGPIGTTPADHVANITTGLNAFILKEETLTLETGVTLTIGDNNFPLAFAGDAGTSGGAQLKGTGTVSVAGIKISGGSRGWRVFGGDTIAIVYDGTTAATIKNRGTGATEFTAGGAGAAITVPASTTLNIGANTTLELAGTSTTAGGVIVLTGDASTGAALAFGATTSKLLLGDGTGGTAAAGVATITIGGEAVTSTGLAVGDYLQKGGVLVQIGGTTAGSIQAGTDDVTLASNSAFTGS
jgi:hypothetical protein